MKALNLTGIALLLIVSTAISAIAAYISVYGMIAIFAGHALVVGLMIASIELGKLVATCWLKFNWKNKNVSLIHKAYLLVAIITVMFLTALGAYSFLSSAHLAQNTPLIGVTTQTQVLQSRLDTFNREKIRLTTRESQMDKTGDAYLSGGTPRGAERAMSHSKAERAAIEKRLSEIDAASAAITEKLAPLKAATMTVDGKLQAVRYIAEFFGSHDPETAVRIIITILVLVFDPLAVVLLISATISISESMQEDKKIPTPAPLDETVAADHDISEPASEAILEAPVVVSVGNPAPETTTSADIFEKTALSNQKVAEEGQIENQIGDRTPWEQILDLLEANPDTLAELADFVKEKTTPQIHNEWLPRP